MMLAEGILELQSEIQAIRRDLHAHPELRYEEHRTAGVVAAKLRAWGIEVVEGIGGTGVVGTLRRGTSTRAVGLRADMDALPLQEHNAFAHASKHAGKMHACGHDGHTAMLLAGARWLSLHGGFDGVVHFIFQPAEEGGAGARKMIDEGLFERFPCDAVFGVHNWPGTAVGTFSVTPGPMMASSNEFEITVRGKGAHAALPHNGTDPVLVATHLVQALQSIITRNKKPVDAAVLSVTEIHAGDATNIIPDSAVIRGTVRTFTIATLDLIEARMKALTEQLPPAFGASGALHFHRNYPPTINEAGQTAFAVEVMKELVGADNVNAACEPTMGSEDFAYMLLAKPGCYAFIGNGDGSHREGGHGMGPCMLHNPSYDFNDELIPLGGSYWVKLVQRFLPAGA
jgi:hippurate hydrolase